MARWPAGCMSVLFGVSIVIVRWGVLEVGVKFGMSFVFMAFSKPMSLKLSALGSLLNSGQLSSVVCSVLMPVVHCLSQTMTLLHAHCL